MNTQDTRFVAGNRESIFEYDSKTGKEVRNLALGKGSIQGFALAPKGNLLAVVQARRLVVQQLADGKKLLDVPHDSMDLDSDRLAFSPDGTTLALAHGRSVEFWHVPTGKRLDADDRWAGSVVDIRVHGIQLLLHDRDLNLLLWDARTNTLVRRYQSGNGYATEMGLRLFGTPEFSRDGQKIVALPGLDGLTRIFDRTDDKKTVVLEGAEPLCATFSPDGKLVAAQGSDRKLWLWDTATGRPVRRLALPPELESQSILHALYFSPDGRNVWATVANNRIRSTIAWELSTETVRWLHYHPDETKAERQFSHPDLKHIAVTDAHEIRLLRLIDGKEVRRFGGKDVVGHSAAFSPDGKYLVAGLENGGVRCWDAATSTVVRDLPAHDAGITALAFMDQGKTLISAALDGSVIAWDFERLLTTPLHTTPEKLNVHWQQLGEHDAAKALPALQAFIDRPDEAVAFLKTRLRPVPSVAPEHIARLITDLRSNQFALRQRASDELEQAAGQARPLLEQALEKEHVIETRRRIEALLQKLEPPIGAPGLLQAIRAIEVLEQLGTPDARRLLESLAAGGRGHRITEDARAALGRLKQR